MHKKQLNTFLLIFSLLLSSISSYAQEITDAKIKSGLIYKFLDFVKWENEEEIDTFIIGLYGNDPVMLNALKSMESITVKNTPIKVKSYTKIPHITKTQLLMVTYESNNDITKVFDKIKGTHTLLVSDRCDYKRSVMINFIHNVEGKIEFEINPKNMADENLYASPKLLLIGGKQINVRKLYLQTEKSLQNEKERAETIEQELAIKMDEIRLQNAKLTILYDEIKRQNKEIDSQNIEIHNQKNTLKELYDQVDEQEKILNEKSSLNQFLVKEIEKNENDVKLKDKELLKKEGDLTKMQKSINEYTLLQNQLEERINKQLEKINTQELIIILVLAMLTLSLTLGFLVYRNYKIKKEANKILEKLSIVASKTDNAVMIMDENGIFEWLNDGFTRMYGYTLNEFVKDKGNSILEASANPNIEDIFKKCITTKKSIIYETTNRSSSGSKIYIQTTLTPILDKSNNIVKLVSIDANISDVKYAEEKIIQKNKEIQKQADKLAAQANSLTKTNIILEEQKEKLQETLQELKNAQTQLVESEKMASLGLLTAGIAHEINNPVNFINAGIDGLIVTLDDLLPVIRKYEKISNGNATKILKEINNVKKAIDYEELMSGLKVLLANIKTGASRTTEIVRSLKTFSRLDESELKFSDVHENIESTLVMLRNQYKERIEIKKEYGNIPKIECYPGKLNQVLMSILLNAIQAIKGKGEIIIRTRIPKDMNKTIAVEIQDNGTGMTEEIKSHIFEPFFTTKETGKGTGLGLSITYSIMERHNGKIEVESEIGKGSKFMLYLPIINNKKEK